jgi:hypothetical protein
MRLGRKAWATIGIILFVVAAIILFTFYRGQVDKRQQARDELTLAQGQLTILFGQQGDLEEELAQRQDELAQWNDTIAQLEEQLAQAEIKLGQTQDAFPTSVKNIEYEETLFSFANDSNIRLVILTASEMGDASVEDLNFKTASFELDVRGEVAGILDFIKAIVTDEGFKTTVLEPVTITVPQSVTDNQKQDIADGKRQELTAEALSQITTEEMVDYILNAVYQVTGDKGLELMMVREMAETIKTDIGSSLQEGYSSLLSEALAELIEQHISDSIISTIVNPVAQEIADLIDGLPGEGYNQEDLEALLGPDIAGLLGENISGMLQGDIEALLNKYIADIIETEMLDSVPSAQVEEAVAEYVAQQVEAMEMPSAALELVIYTYQGEGE